jgi:hypothetical protein
MINDGENTRVFDFSNGASFYQLFLGFSNNGFYGGVAENGCGGYFSAATLSNEISINDNQWRHFAVIVKPDGYWQVYTNGVLSVTMFAGYPAPVQRKQNYLGKSATSNDPYLNGLIDDFIMYNYIVSSSVIKAAYDRAPTGINSG